MNNGNGFWWKLLGSLFPLAVVGALAMAALKANVDNLAQRVSEMAPREVVNAQYSAILRELQDIKSRLARIEAGLP